VCVGVVLVWVVAGDVATNHELSNSRTNESKIKGAKAENTETDKVQKVGMVLGVVVVLLGGTGICCPMGGQIQSRETRSNKHPKNRKAQ